MKVLEILAEAKARTAFDRAKKKAITDAEKAAREAIKKLEREDAKLEREKNAPTKLTSDQIWNKVETVISNTFPDGDPIDHLIPWMEKNKVTMDVINAAVKKHAKVKDMYAYLASMWDDMASDAMHDANMMLNKGKVPEFNPFIDIVNRDHQGFTGKEKAVKNPNPWEVRLQRDTVRASSGDYQILRHRV